MSSGKSPLQSILDEKNNYMFFNKEMVQGDSGAAANALKEGDYVFLTSNASDLISKWSKIRAISVRQNNVFVDRRTKAVNQYILDGRSEIPAQVQMVIRLWKIRALDHKKSQLFGKLGLTEPLPPCVIMPHNATGNKVLKVMQTRYKKIVEKRKLKAANAAQKGAPPVLPESPQKIATALKTGSASKSAALTQPKSQPKSDPPLKTGGSSEKPPPVQPENSLQSVSPLNTGDPSKGASPLKPARPSKTASPLETDRPPNTRNSSKSTAAPKTETLSKGTSSVNTKSPLKRTSANAESPSKNDASPTIESPSKKAPPHQAERLSNNAGSLSNNASPVRTELPLKRPAPEQSTHLTAQKPGQPSLPERSDSSKRLKTSASDHVQTCLDQQAEIPSEQEKEHKPIYGFNPVLHGERGSKTLTALKYASRKAQVSVLKMQQALEVKSATIKFREMKCPKFEDLERSILFLAGRTLTLPEGEPPCEQSVTEKRNLELVMTELINLMGMCAQLVNPIVRHLIIGNHSHDANGVAEVAAPCESNRKDGSLTEVEGGDKNQANHEHDNTHGPERATAQKDIRPESNSQNTA